MPQLPSSRSGGGRFPGVMCVVSQSSSVGSSPVPSRVTSFGHIHTFVAVFPVLSHVPTPRPVPINALLASSQALLLQGPEPGLSFQRPLACLVDRNTPAVDTVTDREEAGGMRSLFQAACDVGREGTMSGLRSRCGHR